MACSSCNKRSAQPAEIKLASAAQSGPFGSKASAVDLYASMSSIPDVGATVPLIRNWKYRPPSGGWAVEVSISGVIHRYDGTPRLIAQRIASDYEKAGRLVSEAKVWDYLNMVWTNRDPHRAVKADGREPMPQPVQAPNLHLDNSPATFGPSLWAALSLFGIKGHFNKDSWAATISMVTRLLDPATNPNGCQECHEKWTIYRLDNPPENVENEHQAAFWIFNIHNEVNRKLGKKVIPFEDAVRINRWAFSLESGTAKPI